ncbi:MAG: hypothetical protein HWE22_11290 [Flavobacteriales bacterium]|nr:hypothetical protein [Flavobacteriales bacterium]
MTRITLVILSFLTFSCGNYSNEPSSLEKTESENPQKSQIEIYAENSTEVNDTKEIKSIWDTISMKVDWFIKNKSINRDLKNIPNDFLNFYNQFISDSSYQKEHIDFKNLIGVYGECETTIYINKRNWIISNWNFLDFFNVDNNTDSIDGWDNRYYFDNKKFYYQFDLKEIGTIYQVGFEKISDKWKMTLYFVNNC